MSAILYNSIWLVSMAALLAIAAACLWQHLRRRQTDITQPTASTGRVFADEHGITYEFGDNPPQRMPWGDLNEVLVYAEDAFPIGGIYWGLGNSEQNGLVIPWDAVGAEDLLKALQTRLPGFDNEAVVRASGMLDGCEQVWKRVT